MKIRFFARQTSLSETVYVRVYSGSSFNSDKNKYTGSLFDYSTKTGIILKKNSFSNTYGKIKAKANIQNKDAINKKLQELKDYLFDCYNDTIISDNNFHKNWLKDRVNQFFNRVSQTESYKKYLIDWADYQIENDTLNKRTGKPITDGTKRKYKSVLSNLKAFEKHKKTKILLRGLNYDFYKEYVNYCINTQKYTLNTTGTRIRTLKTWINEANKRGYCNVDLSSFQTMTNETKDVYLTEAEINRIFKHDFSDNLKLANVRDLLIIGVRTGLRVSDFMSLNIDNIKDEFIEVKTKKTGAAVIIPLHPQIKTVIKRNKGKLPRAISDQRFNDYVKIVCKEAEINTIVEGGKQNPETKRKEYGMYEKHELITSHTCRRSFASNLYGKVDITTIMGITGHRTEKEFLKYIKVTPKQHAEKLKEYYSKVEAENRGTEIAPMRVAK